MTLFAGGKHGRADMSDTQRVAIVTGAAGEER
jgi:hypothetical protein